MLQQALEKLKDKSGIGGQKEKDMAPAVSEALADFCRQDGEFARAVVDGGSFADCMKAVAKGVGSSISDLEAYRRAVRFYFPGAEVRFRMALELCPGHGQEPPAPVPDKPRGLLLDLTDFL